jgi:hypothetical protein
MARRLVHFQRRRLIGNFAIISYQWVPESGLDLDTRTKLIIPDVGADLGWARDTSTEGLSGPYMAWQGDNTGNSGSEDVWIYFENLNADYPDLEAFNIRLRAFWYGVAGDGRINLKTRLWPNLASFQNDDPPTDIDQSKQLKTSDVRDDVDGDDVATLVYRSGVITYQD